MKNGKIGMKQSAIKTGSCKPGEKDDGTGKLLYVTSSHDLFKQETDIDFEIIISSFCALTRMTIVLR